MKKQEIQRRDFGSLSDMVARECGNIVGGCIFAEIPLAQIKPYHNHVFRLYEGERQQDMIDSIKEYGIMNPVIVQKAGKSQYEMLSGHNRMICAERAGLHNIPAFIKENLTEEQALAYVIETNLMQRSFTDMLPSEEAVVLDSRYKKLMSESKQSAIRREIEILEASGSTGESLLETRGRTDAKVGKEYGLSHASVARLLSLNHVILEFRQMVDNNSLSLYAACDLAQLSYEAQRWILEYSQKLHYPLNMKNANQFKKQK